MKNLLILSKGAASVLLVLAVISTALPAKANTDTLNIDDPFSIVCEAMAKIGFGCSGATPTSTYFSPTPTPNITPNNKSTNSGLTDAIYTAGKSATRGDATLVRVRGKAEIYEIIGGKKHFIPTKDIFYDYGFKDELIQDITAEQLARYPRMKLVRVNGDNKKNYYLTEGSMVRLIPDKKVSESYGDRDEDIIVISKKEFNFYPSNQFVFLERPLKRDVFQLVNGKKRYVTPMAVARMGVRDIDVAPVNETELSYYKMGSPIVY